jgi:hypothetical protein
MCAAQSRKGTFTVATPESGTPAAVSITAYPVPLKLSRRMSAPTDAKKQAAKKVARGQATSIQ